MSPILLSYHTSVNQREGGQLKLPDFASPSMSDLCERLWIQEVRLVYMPFSLFLINGYLVVVLLLLLLLSPV